MPPIPESSQAGGWYQELTIRFEDGTARNFFLHFTRTGRHVPEPARAAPWTRLDFHKCPGCPLPEGTAHCPAARSLESTLAKLEGHASFEVVRATAVDGGERSSEVRWPLQQVGSVFVQLAVFSSGCPIGDTLRPYLQDLRPFATMAELTRHIVGRLLLKHRGAVESSTREMTRRLEPLHAVFRHLSLRLTQRCDLGGGDAISNSIARMDAFALLLAMQIEQVCAQIGREMGWTGKAETPRTSGLWDRLKAALLRRKV